MPPPHTMKPMPSEGFEWSAGNYNPSELEKWKQKIYGAEYYDDETPAETPIWNQNKSENGESSHGTDNRPTRKSNTTNLSDRYFDENIAAISSNWDEEDNTCHNILYQKPRAFIKKHFQRTNKHLMMMILMMGMMAFMMGFGHMFRSGAETAIPNTSAAAAASTSSTTFSTTEDEAKLDERKPSSLFETKTADMVMEEHSTIVSKKTRGSNRRNIRI